MTRRILAIIAILLCTTLAWTILGTTIFARTYSAGKNLTDQVATIWGAPQKQYAPTAAATSTIQKTTGTKIVEETVLTPLPLEQSRVRVAFDLEQRQKGLLWFPTYRVAFQGTYLFRNHASDAVTVKLRFPAANAVYDDLVFRVDGRPVTMTTKDNAISTTIQRPPGAPIRVEFAYRSQGLASWHYAFADDVAQVRDFALEMTTDFKAIDFPAGTMSPTEKKEIRGGWNLRWSYENLLTGYAIGMTMPEKLQPGPLAGRISYFAPVSLLFFFFLIFIITTMRGIDLHPMNYFFLAAAFFAFHLLLAYLVDHVSLHLAFAICAAVSIFLVVSYLRLVVGMRFAMFEAALTQFVYLVAFSYAFFFKGFTGLAVTIGAILTLFLVMQMTGRIRWSERF